MLYTIFLWWGGGDHTNEAYLLFHHNEKYFLMLIFEHLFGDVSTNVLGHHQTQPRPKVQKNDKEYGGNFEIFEKIYLWKAWRLHMVCRCDSLLFANSLDWLTVVWSQWQLLLQSVLRIQLYTLPREFLWGLLDIHFSVINRKSARYAQMLKINLTHDDESTAIWDTVW